MNRQLPVAALGRRAGQVVRRPGLGAALGARLRGDYVVDAWGLDQDLGACAAGLAATISRVQLRGRDNLPVEGGALVVYNRRLGLAEPLVVAAGLHRGTGQPARVACRADLPILRGLLRRVGAVAADPTEVTSLLRKGEVVAVPAAIDVLSGDAGEVDPGILRCALDADVPVLPTGVRMHLGGLRWVVDIGRPVHRPRRTGALAATHVAEQTQAALAELLAATPR